MSATLHASPELAPPPLETVVPQQAEVIMSQLPEPLNLSPVERPTMSDGWEYHGQNAERVEKAIEDAPFLPNPEVVRGIETFYGEHRQLGKTIDTMLEFEPPVDPAERAQEAALLQATLDASPLKEQVEHFFTEPDLHYRSDQMNSRVALPALAAMRLQRLKNPDDTKLKEAELRLMKAASEVVYAEPSLGITTIGEAEIAEVTARQEAIKKRFAESGLFIQDTRVPDSNWFHNKNPKLRGVESFLDDPATPIKMAQQKFWDDTRFAGQMLFHGSTHFDDMYKTGMIATRRVQEHYYGDYQTRNLKQDGDRLHSPVIHWSEMYDENGYRTVQGTENAGTVAVPLAEIIKYAPFARDSEYATLRLKPELEPAVIPKITINDGTGRIGSGMDDKQGKSGVDRSFYRTAHDSDRNAALDEAPDGYAIPLNEKTVRIALGEEAKDTYRYGVGEHFPSHLEIDVANPYSFNSQMTDADKAERKDAIQQAIVSLQHQSIQQYEGQVVVPIRSGIMEFYVSDGGTLAYRPPAEFNRRSAA